MGRELLFLDPKETEGLMYKAHGNHILAVGATGAGKTSTLFKLAYNLWKQKETVIWRDDANLEFLSLVKYVPVKLYLPEGCDLLVEEVLTKSQLKRVEKAEYNWSRIKEIFPTFDSDRFNILLFDLFTTDPQLVVKFWVSFFWEIYRYKRMRIKEPWSLVVDELNDLAPGKARGTFKGQLTLSSRIYSSMKKFRKMSLRLVGSTHNYNDLHAPVRSQFNYYLLRRMRRDVVPGRFHSFAHKIEKMRQNQCLVVDRHGNFQFVEPWTERTRWHLNPDEIVTLKPRKYMVPWSGDVVDEEEEKGQAQWKHRALLLLRLIDRLAVPIDYNTVSSMLDLSKSYSHQLWSQAEELPQAEVNEAYQALVELVT